MRSGLNPCSFQQARLEKIIFGALVLWGGGEVMQCIHLGTTGAFPGVSTDDNVVTCYSFSAESPRKRSSQPGHSPMERGGSEQYTECHAGRAEHTPDSTENGAGGAGGEGGGGSGGPYSVGTVSLSATWYCSRRRRSSAVCLTSRTKSHRNTKASALGRCVAMACWMDVKPPAAPEGRGEHRVAIWADL